MKTSTKIMKFGGSSVANATNINRVIDIVLQSRRRGEKKVVVVSALGGITDELVNLATLASKENRKYKIIFANIRERHDRVVEELIPLVNRKKVSLEVNKKYKELEEIIKATLSKNFMAREVYLRYLDAVMSFGEQLSAYIISEAIKNRGYECQFVDARSIIKTDDNFGNANVNLKSSYKLASRIFKNKKEEPPIFIMGGFIASTARGMTTTLGRGGSDYTASLVGAALGASVIEIWTDVDGMLTADPRIVPHVRLVRELSFSEASELAYFGAKVLHPNTILPTVAKNIPVRILNSRKPKNKGTLITNKISRGRSGLAAIATKRGVSIINITSTRMLMAHGFLKRLFEVFSRFNTAVDVITTSEVTVSVTIDDTRNLALILKNLKVFADVTSESGMAIVCVVGEGLQHNHDLASMVVKTLGEEKLSMLSFSASRRNITIVLPDRNVPKAMNKLHNVFFTKSK